MRDVKVTAGPWEVIRSYDRMRVVGIGNPRLQIQIAAFEHGSVMLVDATMMAAAPEMYEALEAAVQLIDGDIGPGRENEVRELIVSAMKKARDEE